MLQCFCSTCTAIWSAPGLSNRMHIGPHLQCYWSVFLPFVLWNWREGRPCGRDGCALVQPDESSESNKPVERWAWWRHHVENERLRSRAVWKKAREQEPAPSEHTCHEVCGEDERSFVRKQTSFFLLHSIYSAPSPTLFICQPPLWSSPCTHMCARICRKIIFHSVLLNKGKIGGFPSYLPTAACTVCSLLLQLGTGI